MGRDNFTFYVPIKQHQGDQIKMDKTAGACGMFVEEQKCINILLEASNGNRTLRTPRNRWDNNIKVDVKGMGWVGMDWINLVQDKEKRKALVNMIMNIQVP
jgi:hypothetical protein